MKKLGLNHESFHDVIKKEGQAQEEIVWIKLTRSIKLQTASPWNTSLRLIYLFHFWTLLFSSSLHHHLSLKKIARLWAKKKCVSLWKKHSSFFRKKHKPRASAYIPTKYLAKESWVACNTSQNKKKELKTTRGANKIRKSKVSRILFTLRITLDEPSLDT